MRLGRLLVFGLVMLGVSGIGYAEEAKKKPSKSEADEAVSWEGADDEVSESTAPASIKRAPKTTTPRSAAAYRSKPQPRPHRGQFRIPVGLSFLSGIFDLADYFEERLDANIDEVYPVGLSLSPHYEFAHGSRIGVDIGPGTIMMIDSGIDASDSDIDYLGIPIGLYYGFTFIPKAAVSPYARIGLKYHIVDSDWVDESTPGPTAAFGVEFARRSAVGVGLEIAYDGAEITMLDGEKIRPGQVLFSLRAIF